MVILQNDNGPGFARIVLAPATIQISPRLITSPIGDTINEFLIFLGIPAPGGGQRLLVRLSGEICRANIGHPDLDWAQTLLA